MIAHSGKFRVGLHTYLACGQLKVKDTVRAQPRLKRIVASRAYRTNSDEPFEAPEHSFPQICLRKVAIRSKTNSNFGD